MLRSITCKQGGFSLVELLVGVAVGFFVVLAASTIYLNTFSSSAVATHLVKLNQNMRSIMDIMVYDIHRAGAWGRAVPGERNNLFTRRVGDGRTDTSVISDLYISTDGSCILYSYDADQDPAPPAPPVLPTSAEFFGFRYNSTTKQIEVLDQTGVAPVTDTSVAIANCAIYSWQPVNRTNEVVVTALTFSTAGSQCLAFNPTTFTPNNTATFVRWQLTAANSSVAACDTTVSGGSSVPAATAGTFSPSGVTIASTLTGLAEVRQIVVTLTASHARDATLTRTLTETIRVRNDRVI